MQCCVACEHLSSLGSKLPVCATETKVALVDVIIVLNVPTPRVIARFRPAEASQKSLVYHVADFCRDWGGEVVQRGRCRRQLRLGSGANKVE